MGPALSIGVDVLIIHAQHSVFGGFRLLTSPATLPQTAYTFALAPGPNIQGTDLTILNDSVKAFSVEPGGKFLYGDRIVHQYLFMPCRILHVVPADRLRVLGLL